MMELSLHGVWVPMQDQISSLVTRVLYVIFQSIHKEHWYPLFRAIIQSGSGIIMQAQIAPWWKVTQLQSNQSSSIKMVHCWCLRLMTSSLRFGMCTTRSLRRLCRVIRIGFARLNFHLTLAWWHLVVMTGALDFGTCRQRRWSTLLTIMQEWSRA